MRYALALDLVDDIAKIDAYEKAHLAIWPEVRRHLRAEGVLHMEIYRLGTRLFMLMDVDPAVYSAESTAAAALADPTLVEWEKMMDRYQRPTPWAVKGDKWTPMQRVVSL
jgi:L-rhamnose mutarotase